LADIGPIDNGILNLPGIFLAHWFSALTAESDAWAKFGPTGAF
jgi:hypothetical protein